MVVSGGGEVVVGSAAPTWKLTVVVGRLALCSVPTVLAVLGVAVGRTVLLFTAAVVAIVVEAMIVVKVEVVVGVGSEGMDLVGAACLGGQHRGWPRPPGSLWQYGSRSLDAQKVPDELSQQDCGQNET